MRKWLIILGILIVVVGFTTTPKVNGITDPEAVKKAVNKSLPLLQTTSHVFLENSGGCQSCHHQDLTAVDLSLAKEKGIAINDTILNETLQSVVDVLSSRKDIITENTDPTTIDIVMSSAYQLWALWANQYRSNKLLELLVKNLMQRQAKEGCWVTPSVRPPLEYYSFTATALVSKAIQYYVPSSLQADASARIEKARLWLSRTDPETNEERVFQLLGLAWTNGDAELVQKQAKKLLATQHGDGGWSQLTHLPSDAYATGQALYALNECGYLKSTDQAFQKGISFLLKTQFDDGSWKVESRSFPVLPFVYNGFPHEKNQFISAAGTNWATMALILSLE